MPFDLGLAVQPATGERAARRVAARYQVDPVRRYETPALVWSLGFYGCYLAGIAGLVPMWAAFVAGVICFVRYFNRIHESLHANSRNSAWHPVRWLLVIVGPVYLGHGELRELHLMHHRELDRADGHADPDRGMLAASPWRSALACLLQPEESALFHLRRHGLSPRLAAKMTAHAGVFAGLMWLGGWPGALLYNLTVRVGNTAAFFVFSWVVHRPEHYQLRPPRFPAALAAVWALVFGRENLRGVRFHYLHHRFPHVPDRHLPALAHELVELGPS